MPGTPQPSAMVVEDHEMVSDMLAQHLGRAGFTVTGVARSAAAAVTLADRHVPDLVLCDVQLEGPANGIDLTRQLLRKHAGLVVVMISAEYDAETVAQAYSAGAVGYVSKRASAPELIQAITDALAGAKEVADRHTYRRILDGIRTPKSLGGTRALTPREREVLALMGRGVTTTSALAQQLHISTSSVRTHVENCLRKLGAHSRAEAVALAYQRGLIRQ